MWFFNDFAQGPTLRIPYSSGCISVFAQLKVIEKPIHLSNPDEKAEPMTLSSEIDEKKIFS